MSRITEDFQEDFLFCRGEHIGAEKADFDDTSWETITLPHDWSIYGSFRRDYPTCSGGGFRPAGLGWYRKHFVLPEEYCGKRIELLFGGIYRKPTVYLNGKQVGHWVNGYVTKLLDITDAVQYGTENVLAVRVDNEEQPASRYYTGCGIYRNVKLLVRDKLFIRNRNPFITTPEVSEESAVVHIETEISNGYSEEKPFSIQYEISNADGVVVSRCIAQEERLNPGSSVTITTDITVAGAILWEPMQPYLYTLHTAVMSGDRETDRSSCRFGIRSIAFDSDKGFLCNGKHIYIKGVCLHHDNGALGAAENLEADRRKLMVMREMGANAIRLAHNPFHEGFLDLCDAMGFLVMDEFFDEWRIPKHPPALQRDGSIQRVPGKNYHLYFDDHWKEDMVTTIIRDRNHPSIILYSIGNEIPEQWYTIDGAEQTAEMLVHTVKAHDPTRPVTCACKFDHDEKTAAFCSVLDVVGYNYAEPLYDAHHQKFPSRKMIGSETISIAPFWKRSIQDLSVLGEVNRYEERQMGECFDTRSVRICSAEWSMDKHRNTPFVSGFFIWTGVDYLGEPTPHPWPSRSSYFGVADTCCFPKDSYYFYKAFWSDEPVLHLLPHWNQEVPVGTMIDVIAYTNCSRAVLFLNGESMGEAEYNPQKGQHLSWKIPYIPGELKAVGYSDNGEKSAEDCICTAGEPAEIRLKPNTVFLRKDGKDTLFIQVEIVDARGNIVPAATEMITFTAEEGLEIIGVDNGDPEYTGDLKSNRIPTLGGLALVIVQSKQRTGSFEVRAEAKNLRHAVVSLDVI